MFPPSFRTQNTKTDGATLHVRSGGQGPAVVMLHGFGDTGDMWAPLAHALVRNQPSSFRISGAWACRRILRAATTRRRKPATSRACWTR